MGVEGKVRAVGSTPELGGSNGRATEDFPRIAAPIFFSTCSISALFASAWRVSACFAFSASLGLLEKKVLPRSRVNSPSAVSGVENAFARF